MYVSDAYNEQVNLGMRNQTEYMSRDETHFSEPSNRSTGNIYTPSSTYRDVETPIWVSKNENEQSTIYMINSSVMHGKQKTNDASIDLEQPDYEYAHTKM